MDWFLAGEALAIVIVSIVGFVSFVTVIERYPDVATAVLIIGLIFVFTVLVYKVLGG